MSDNPSAASQETFLRFRAKLNELFQMDRAELDFGIYRIMNIKRAEVSRYLDQDLLPQVEEILSAASSGQTKSAEEALAALEKQLRDAGVDPATSPKVRELRALLGTAGGQDELRQRAFSHLLTFFSRYYDKGDFISKRRYKDGTYMIPYNGEEVKLVWANMDQYYIKTSEYLRDYRFFLDPEKTLRMTFKLVEGDAERDNIKGKNRVFILCEEEPVTMTDDGLVARFEYIPSETKQADAIKEAAAAILARAARFRPYLEQKEDTSGKTLLEKHLAGYTARNSEDFFIHKDLKSFLERELDFFLKNEVLRIDDMLDTQGEGLQSQIHLARAMKEVGSRIIAMLAQIEEFQKKLWLKKKFVTRTDYMVTLDKIIEKAPQLLSRIIDNDEQREEWIRLFAIDEITEDRESLPGLGGATFSIPLTETFLRANDKLVLDTRFFDREFVTALLAGFDDIDEATDGLLVHSENFQALNLLQERYREKVKCVYIDPPYNAKSSEIMYKNTFKHASWLSLMENRIESSKRFLDDKCVYIIAIDEVENNKIGLLLSEIFSDSEIASISIVHNPTGQQGNNFSFTHEFAIFIFPKNLKCIGLEDREDPMREATPDIRPLRNVSSGKNHLRSSAANCFYPIYVKNGKINGFGDVCPDDFHPDSINIKRDDEIIEVYPIDPSGVESKWVFARASVGEIAAELTAEYDQAKKSWDIIRKKTKFRYKSLWSDKRYSANSWGSVILNNILPNGSFSYPKSIYTERDCIDAGLNNQIHGTTLDFFAGSGTTGHAVINLNREDGGSRKYILVEMGEYFDTVLKPRIAKVIYSTEWKEGKPQTRNTGISQLVKYMRLESYEDTLNNLTVPEKGEYSSLLEQGVEREFREGYLLGYMLDREAEAARMTVDRFFHPFDSILHVAGDTVGERRPQTIDLVETFNYLIGLTVKSCYQVAGCHIVEGYDPAGDHVLIVWRDLDRTGNTALDELFLKQRINIRDREFDLIYVNGDNNLENLRRDDETWKVRLIEHEFTARMFSGSEV